VSKTKITAIDLMTEMMAKVNMLNEVSVVPVLVWRGRPRPRALAVNAIFRG
jgi:hypothetical protein